MLLQAPDIVKELRSLMENSSVVKVIHDCRQDPAALFYQLQIGLLMCSTLRCSPCLLISFTKPSQSYEPVSLLELALSSRGTAEGDVCTSLVLLVSGRAVCCAGCLWLGCFLGWHAGRSAAKPTSLWTDKASGHIRLAASHNQKRDVCIEAFGRYMCVAYRMLWGTGQLSIGSWSN